MRHPFAFIAFAVFAACALSACGAPAEAPVAVGMLEFDRVELVAESAEAIVAVDASEGMLVETGQAILRFDTSLFSAKIAQALQTAERLRARRDEVARGPRSERVAEARARLTAAEAAVRTAAAELSRSEELHREGAESRSRLDAQRLAFEQATARREELAEALREARTGATPEENRAAEAAVAEAEEAIRELMIREAKYVVRAPAPGRIDLLPFEKGERPPQGAVVAVLLVGRTPYARVQVSEEIRARVTVGTRAELRIDGVSAPVTGTVRNISSEPSFTPYYSLTERERGRLSYPAEIELEGVAMDLPAGVPVEARFLFDGASSGVPETREHGAGSPVTREHGAGSPETRTSGADDAGR